MTHEEIFAYNKFTPPTLPRPFTFAAIGLAHGHIYGMCQGLINAGARMKYVYESDPALLAAFLKKYPNVTVAGSEDEILSDPEVELIATADIPSQRAPLTVRAMASGKDVFSDKAPVISHSQLEDVKRAAAQYGRKLFVYYSEFVAVEASLFAKQLIDRGVIGRVFSINIVAPHRLSPDTRPAWFFKRECTGGIITDIGSHQLQQFLAYSGAEDATVQSARVNNYFYSSYAPDGGFDDFGDLTIVADNGITGYIRIDWSSPAGIGTWGDVRATILGERGYIELRKNCNIGMPKVANTVYVATDDGVFSESVSGKVGVRFYSDVIHDCITRETTAMTEQMTYRAIELALDAQKMALLAKKN